MWNAKRIRFLAFVIAFISWTFPSSLPAVTTTINGQLGDLDGNGDSGAGEAAVVQAAVACWDARITTNRNFTLQINAMGLTGSTCANGAHTALDGNNIPTAGNVNVDNDNSICGTTANNWFVDPTPLASLEFTPDLANQWRFLNGPGQFDLMLNMLHEVGHAHGWVCGASCNRTSPDNPRYDALMNPQPGNFVTGTTVNLQAGLATPNPFNVPLRGDGLPVPQVNELSHPGNPVDLMEGFFSPGQRETQSVVDVDLFARAYGDTVNFPPTINAGADITSECNAAGGSNVTLDASGSTDPENDTLTYSWTCPTVTLANANTAMANGFFPLSQTETCRVDATDLAACPADADTATVTVVDTIPPGIMCPADVTTECDAVGGTAASDPDIVAFLNDSVASDTCDPSVVPSNNAPGFFPVGPTLVTFTAADDSANASVCSANVTVVDTTPPMPQCNAPSTIVPPDAPISFTGTATDICSATTVMITDFDCFAFTKKGKRIDKTQSCVVSFSGDTITIHDSGGVGDHITWTVQATDGAGNGITQSCAVEVVNPGQS